MRDIILEKNSYIHKNLCELIVDCLHRKESEWDFVEECDEEFENVAKLKYYLFIILKTGLHQKALPVQGCFPKVHTTYMTSYIDYNKHTHDYINIQRNRKTKKVSSESLSSERSLPW